MMILNSKVHVVVTSSTCVAYQSVLNHCSQNWNPGLLYYCTVIFNLVLGVTCDLSATLYLLA
jgi:hypothetical protein